MIWCTLNCRARRVAIQKVHKNTISQTERWVNDLHCSPDEDSFGRSGAAGTVNATATIEYGSVPSMFVVAGLACVGSA